MEDGYIQLQEPDVKYFVNYCLLGGAKIRRMDLDLKDAFWPGYCNPSIMYDTKDNNWKFIIRNVNYVLHGSQHPYKCYSSWGPVLYSIPFEDGRNLKTRNFLGTAKNPMEDEWEFKQIETRPYTPIWEFWGEEDARLVRWDNKLYTTGVRRDDNKDGRGRMELMRISENATPQEISKLKVKAPGKDDGYCEKNWMPIRDLPYHYVRLANPTIVVKVDPKTGKSEEVVHKDKAPGFVDENFDLLRGSSQVVTWGDYYISLVHTCELWLTASNRKFARYCHVFVVWDKEWNIVKMSPLFSFGNYNVEFTTGLEYKDGKFYIPFALQDNFSFLMEVDESVISNFIDGKLIEEADTTSCVSELNDSKQLFKQLFNPNATQERLFKVGKQYFDERNLAASYCIFTHSADMFENTYEERLYAARSIADLGHRDRHEIGMWMSCIQHDPERPEGYMAAAMYYFYRESWYEALYFAEQSMKYLDSFINNGGELHLYNADGIRLLYNQCLFETDKYPYAIDALDRAGVKHEKNRRVL